MLGGSGHDKRQQPRFELKVWRDPPVGKKKLLKRIMYAAPETGGHGWTDVGDVGEVVWFKRGDIRFDLKDLDVDDHLLIEVYAMDCTYGEHGAVAFIDAVEVTDGCQGGFSQPGAQPIPDPAIPNVITPNNDGMNDTWDVVGIKNACRALTKIYDRWGDLVFEGVQRADSAAWANRVMLWDGWIRSRRKVKGAGTNKRARRRKVRANDGPMYFELKLGNCYEVRTFTGAISIFK